MWRIAAPATEMTTLAEREQLEAIEHERAITGSARYALDERIAEGGMGVVFRARDSLLERNVAIKLAHNVAPGATRRFLAEGQITAQLQHPGIVPVHDLGRLPDGRFFYAMEEVAGITLRAAIHMPEAVWPLRRLVDAFARACDAVAYAHSRGVVHRDLKPPNIMLGDFGEVRVVDWGLASASAIGDDSVIVPERDGTRAGAVLGTPEYMSPEQARGERVDARTDVYALGAVLYEILSGTRPYKEVPHAQVLRTLLAEAPTALEKVAPDAPPVLVALASRCMARDPDARPQNAAEVAAATRSWLDGIERRERARAVLGAVTPTLEQARMMRAEAESLRKEASAQLSRVPAWEGVERKRDAWTMEEQAADRERAAAVLEAKYEQAVRASLELDPEYRDALDATAELYKAALLAAETDHRVADAARFETLLESHDRGAHVAWLRGDGAVSLVTDPPGATVIAERYELRDRRLTPVDGRELGVTPLRAISLARGSYRLRIRKDGFEEVVYPVFLGRGEHWDGVPPDETEPVAIALPPIGTLDVDDCYVPAGWFLSGGDPEAGDPLPSRRLWVDALIMKRFPVTYDEYGEYLDDLERTGSLDPNRVPQFGDTHVPLLERGSDGRHQLRDPLSVTRLESGRCPVGCVDWHSAMAFAEWRSKRDGRSWRLPNDQEWEKAARGVDGRRYPWGDHFDSTFACTVNSQPGAPRPHSVVDFPADEGPYRVRGAAGNVRDWCSNNYSRSGPASSRVDAAPSSATAEEPRMVRGGSFNSHASYARMATRLTGRPHERVLVFGLRLCVSHVHAA